MNELEVTNFQSYLHTYLNFHPRVNIIRGTSNHGKSAIVRAIDWVISNQPRGTPFCNWNKTLKDGVEVNISFDKGSVSRLVNNKFNGYVIFDNDTEEESTLEALRNDVPNEIRIVSNNMDSSNIHRQDDGYFLLQDTPGNVARKLNERSGLGDIDTVALVSKRLLDDCSSKLKLYKTSLEEAETEEEHLSEFEQFAKPIDEINKYFKRMITVSEKVDSLISRIETLEAINQKIDKYNRILSAKEDTEKLAEFLDKRISVSARHTRIGLFVKDIKAIQNKIDMFKEELKFRPDIEEIKKLFAERSEVIEDWKKILYLKQNVLNIKEDIL